MGNPNNFFLEDVEKHIRLMEEEEQNRAKNEKQEEKTPSIKFIRRENNLFQDERAKSNLLSRVMSPPNNHNNIFEFRTLDVDPNHFQANNADRINPLDPS